MNKIIKNTLMLTAITVAAGLLLGLVYEITSAPILTAQEEAKQKAYKAVLSEADSFEEYKDFNAGEIAEVLAEEGYTGEDITGVAVASNKSGDDIGYVVTSVSHDGYGGDIEVSVGIQKDGTVEGIEMLSITETAGLGMKAADAEFKDQFKNKKVEKFSYTKTGEKGEDKIDALSGATITTSAVTNAVDAALFYFHNVLGGGDNE